MNVQIQSVKFDADRKLVEFVEHKMDKLDRFVELKKTYCHAEQRKEQ